MNLHSFRSQHCVHIWTNRQHLHSVSRIYRAFIQKSEHNQSTLAHIPSNPLDPSNSDEFHPSPGTPWFYKASLRIYREPGIRTNWQECQEIAKNLSGIPGNAHGFLWRFSNSIDAQAYNEICPHWALGTILFVMTLNSASSWQAKETKAQNACVQHAELAEDKPMHNANCSVSKKISESTVH